MADNFSPPAVSQPTVKKVKELSEKLRLDLADDQIKDMTDCLHHFLKPYEEVYRMAEPKPPVKYPRTPGYRPSPEENEYNAWYVKTDIPGASNGKLHGKKVAIKDNICVAGVPMMNGTKLLEGYVPEFDATVVTRVLDAGGHITGKSACENFCLSGNSFTNDIAPVLNPHDKSRSTGGSSSGSAALVAAGEVDLAIGGDQGGSIRIPSSWCGVVGIKPTFGLVPYTGAAPIESTIDHLGPMAKNVKDCALFLEVLAGGDGMDARQPEPFPAVPEYSKNVKSDLAGLKVGLVEEGFANCEPAVVDTVKKAAAALVSKGAKVETISVPMHAAGGAIWSPVCMEGGFETMIKKCGYGPSAKGFHSATLMDFQYRSMKSNPENLSIPMKLLALYGEFLKESNNYHFYCRGSNLVMKLTAAYDEKLKEYDVLVMPTLPYLAPKLPKSDVCLKDYIKEAFSMVRNTAPFNATGHPALSINAGMFEGLPVGMMIIGKKWDEQTIFNVAQAHEELMSS